MTFDIEFDILELATCNFAIRCYSTQTLTGFILACTKSWPNLSYSGACSKVLFYIFSLSSRIRVKQTASGNSLYSKSTTSKIYHVKLCIYYAKKDEFLENN